MKFTVKYNTRKFNATFGDNADEVKFICQKDRRLGDCDKAVVDALVAAKLAKVSSKGPGWPLQVVADFDAMIAAKLVISWNIA